MSIQDSIRLIEVSHKTGYDIVYTAVIGSLILAGVFLVGKGLQWFMRFADGD